MPAFLDKPKAECLMLHDLISAATVAPDGWASIVPKGPETALPVQPGNSAVTEFVSIKPLGHDLLSACVTR